jgi:hypothetical protein
MTSCRHGAEGEEKEKDQDQEKILRERKKLLLG